MNKILKAKIVEKFGTQADFAEAVKVDESIVSRVVRGRRSLNYRDQKTWAKVLGSRMKELFENGAQ